jgi:putative membrane protein
MNPTMLIRFSALFLLLYTYATVIRLLLAPIIHLPDLPGGVQGQTVVLLLFSLTHAAYLLGWRQTLTFFLLSAVISWCFEELGVLTGVIYGNYYYTDMLGFKLGEVPIMIPLAWFMMIYPSYIIANLIAEGEVATYDRSLSMIFKLSLLGAMVMTAWDLLIDPVLSGPAYRAWVWVDGGPYYGVPAQNYVGWILTTFTVYFCYRLYEKMHAPASQDEVTTLIASMPLVAYASVMIANSFGSTIEGLQVIGPFVMGLPLLIALFRLLRTHRVPT